ncbi:alpha/beta hydrolase [Parazoarcus communis]|uniref:Alpha/beta hydrolase n=1 Tax=Parazoarcus communis TaxID=41977 RepID=A0A2U8H4W5_9RHOO|nr:alpha/beta hydrolase [Parazoarcus communis]AWI80972.1 alpha/beta hydrolase [Parazoarcus communis]
MKLRTTPISIPAESIWLDGTLSHAPDVRGLVLILQPGANPIVHKRQTLIAGVVQDAGFATLSLDLMTRHEELHDQDASFNVTRLAERLLAANDWIEHQPPLEALPIGLLAFGTASAAIVRAAAKKPDRFGVLACLAGRPDLAGAGPLRSLRAPTLFIVGREDPGTAILRQAFDMIPGDHEWRAANGGEIEHLSPENLRQSAGFVADWMLRKMPPRQDQVPDEFEFDLPEDHALPPEET